jgi:hypothetical protein
MALQVASYKIQLECFFEGDLTMQMPPPSLDTQKLVALQQNAAATLAAAIIAASGRPHSVQEALDLLQDVSFSLFPKPQHAIYQKWKEADKLSEVHK